MTDAAIGDRGRSAAHPAPERASVGRGVLWFGIFGAPAAWSAQTLVNLAIASHGCFPRLEPRDAPVTSVRGIAIVVSAIAVLVVLAATATATRSWMRTRKEHHGAAGTARQHPPVTALHETGEGRTRFMALCGVLTSVTFLVLSLVHAAAALTIGPCAG